MAAGFFPVLSLRATDEGPYVQRMFSGEIGGVVVAEVLAPAACAAWVERLDAGALPAAPARFAAEFEAFSIGPCLDQSEGDLEGYLSCVPPFEAALAGAIPGVDLLEHLLAALARVAAGWIPSRPRTGDGRRYGLVTLRRLPPGGLIPPHCENEQLPRAAYRDLRDRIDTAALMSFYLTLRPADEGGELAVHRFDHGATGDRVQHGHSDVAAEVDRAERAVVRPAAGSLVVFEGGRRFHQVREVRGARSRWTLGGFLAPTRARDALHAWA
jgi:hapalindole-type alkaloid chlorinase